MSISTLLFNCSVNKLCILRCLDRQNFKAQAMVDWRQRIAIVIIWGRDRLKAIKPILANETQLSQITFRCINQLMYRVIICRIVISTTGMSIKTSLVSKILLRAWQRQKDNHVQTTSFLLRFQSDENGFLHLTIFQIKTIRHGILINFLFLLWVIGNVWIFNTWNR